MNSRLPTSSEKTSYFWAEPSRELIHAIEIVEDLQRALKNTKFVFEVDEYYQKIIAKCKTFIKQQNGSEIPSNMDKIQLYYVEPIFIFQNTIEIFNPELSKTHKLKLIGEGSYAQVFKYKDGFYEKIFVLKRAKKDLNEKEISRFKREFEEMKKFNSPYIVEVFCYNNNTNEYIMEYMDYSLDNYIKKYNSELTLSNRKKLGLQILKAFSYIHSKDRLHRDISPKNILIKCYDDVPVVKVADFGLVKIPDSKLTSVNTDYKGYFNDPALRLEGFDSYCILHETYALTRLLFFVMTGKTNTDRIKDSSIRKFIEKGLNPDKTKRFQNVNELDQAFRQLFNKNC